MAAGPVGLEEQNFNAGACRRQVDLGHGDGAVTETITHDEEIVAARFVESHRPAFPEAVA